MQTFLPHPDFTKSAQCLDNKRLGKQRVEAKQILNILEQKSHGVDMTRKWGNHPAVLMWEGCETALEWYLRECIREWAKRGFQNSIVVSDYVGFVSMPWWWENRKFHRSHKSNLLRKDPVHYGQFGWSVPDDLEYWWPSKHLIPA